MKEALEADRVGTLSGHTTISQSFNCHINFYFHELYMIRYILYCYTTNEYTYNSLKQHIYYFMVSVGQDCRHSLAGSFALGLTRL